MTMIDAGGVKPRQVKKPKASGGRPREVRVDDLADLCEPLFLYVCRLNRAARKGGAAFDHVQVRGEIRSIVKTIGNRCAEAGLGDQFARVRKLLLGFADFMVENSALGFAGKWKRLLHDDEQDRDPNYDRTFFQDLDDTLEDPSPEATQRLAVYYTCLGLGFGGVHKDDPNQLLRVYTSRVAARLGDLIEADESAPICAQAYQHTDERALERQTTGGLAMLAVAVAGLILIAFAVNGMLYKLRTGQVEQNLKYLQNVVSAPAK